MQNQILLSAQKINILYARVSTKYEFISEIARSFGVELIVIYRFEGGRKKN